MKMSQSIPLLPFDQSAQKTSVRKKGQSSRFASAVNDLDLSEWRSLHDVLTDSLWIIPERDKSGAHSGEYHGNFIPQIPRQMMVRYTKKHDVVLDAFLGSGTTLIECRRLGRHGIGIELIHSVAQKAQMAISREKNLDQVQTVVIEGDTREPETTDRIKNALREIGKPQVQLLILHPPYHDIVKFSKDPRDLCNAPSLEAFLDSFSSALRNVSPFLENSRYLALVIGDKYTLGEWVPLGFYTMQRIMQEGYKLISIIVKNMEGNRAKRNLQNLWRVRALRGGFYIFKHEYVMVFKKK